MKRLHVLFIAMVVLLASMSAKTMAALDESEVVALRDFYLANRAVLDAGTPAWGMNASNVCEITVPWAGIICASGHVSSITFNKASLGGTIPDSIGGLTYLRGLYLTETDLIGTVPASLATIPNLNALVLRGNRLLLCADSVPAFGPAMTACDVRDQMTTICLSGCCGCNANWVSKCSSNVPSCQACTNVAPIEYPNANCSNGYRVIPGPYTGSLTVTGKVAIVGDFSLPVGEVLVFIGLKSTLNVTGRANIRSHGVVLALPEADEKSLRTSTTTGSILTSQRVTYMTVGDPTRTIGSFNGANILVTAHTIRACRRPVTTSVGDAARWTVSVRGANSCNTWWIILLAMSPTIIALLAGLIIGLCSCR